jgi:hypothetical protein
MKRRDRTWGGSFAYGGQSTIDTDGLTGGMKIAKAGDRVLPVAPAHDVKANDKSVDIEDSKDVVTIQ